MAKEFVLEPAQRRGVLLALNAVYRIPNMRKSWQNHLYNAALQDATRTLYRLLGANDEDACVEVRRELMDLSRAERSAAKQAARAND